MIASRSTSPRSTNGTFSSHYFEREDVFDVLSKYYNGDQYRFEVPLTDLDGIESTLDEYFYEPCIIKTADFASIASSKSRTLPTRIFCAIRSQHWTREGHNVFIIKDESAKREALEAGANPITDTEFVLGL